MAGSCFPKDTKGLVSTGEKFKTNLSIVKSVIKSNENRKKLHTEKIKKILGSLKGKRIAFLGVTFKPNTDDMRDSVSLKMIPALCKQGSKITYYDPTGSKKTLKILKTVNLKKVLKKLVTMLI